MATVITNSGHYEAIAAAIREKHDVTDTYKPSQMADAIKSISGNLIMDTVNLHDANTDIADIYLKNGIETSYEGWNTTDYIPIKSGVTYAIQSTWLIKGEYCGIYNHDKNYVSKLSGGFWSTAGGASLFVANIDGYIRFSESKNAVTAIKMYACIGGFKSKNPDNYGKQMSLLMDYLDSIDA